MKPWNDETLWMEGVVRERGGSIEFMKKVRLQSMQADSRYQVWESGKWTGSDKTPSHGSSHSRLCSHKKAMAH